MSANAISGHQFYAEANLLREEGAEILRRAKRDVEAVILGESV